MIRVFQQEGDFTMMREDLEKYHADPAWRAAYEAALARLPGGTGGDADAVYLAASAADAEMMAAQAGRIAQAEAVEQARTRAASNHEVDPVHQVEADPAAAARKAVAALNASRGHHEQAKANGVAEVAENEPTAEMSAAAKAVAAINARRGA